MTEELFREDATLAECEASVVSAGPEGVGLDRTVFYPLGGGQAGDRGTLRLADGRELRIADTRKLWLDIQVPVDRQSQVATKGAVVTGRSLGREERD